MSLERAPETVVARLRSHSRALFLPTIALVVDIAAAVYFGLTLPEQWERWAVLGAGVVFAFLVFIAPLFSWLARNYTITTRRTILRSGLLTRTRQELLHSRGYDVTVKQSGLQWMLRSGDVLINTGLEHPTVLRDVPGASLVQSALHELMEENSLLVASRRQAQAAQAQAAQSQTPAHDELPPNGAV